MLSLLKDHSKWDPLASENSQKCLSELISLLTIWKPKYSFETFLQLCSWCFCNTNSTIFMLHFCIHGTQFDTSGWWYAQKLSVFQNRYFDSVFGFIFAIDIGKVHERSEKCGLFVNVWSSSVAGCICDLDWIFAPRFETVWRIRNGEHWAEYSSDLYRYFDVRLSSSYGRKY